MGDTMPGWTKRLPVVALAFILWLVSVVVALWQIVIVQRLLLRIYGRLGGGYWSGVVLRDASVIVLGILWLALVIFTAEYHWKRVGQRTSWRLFAWVFGVEAAILAVAAVV